MKKTTLSSNMVTKAVVEFLKKTHREKILPEVTEELEAVLDKEKKIKQILVTSVVNLTPDQKDFIQNYIWEELGLKLPVTNKIDKHLIGGLTIQVSDWFLDASIVNELKRLKQVLMQ